MADSDDNCSAESTKTTQPAETARWRTFKAAIGAFLHRRSRAVKQAEHIIDELRELNQLHGKLGQQLMGDHEGLLWAMWFGRSGNATIVTCLVVLGMVLLHSPQWLSFTVAGIGLAIAAVCLLLAIGHLTEWREYRRGNIIVDEDPTPRPITTTRKKPRSGRRSGPDGHSMRRRRRLHPCACIEGHCTAVTPYNAKYDG